MVDIDYYAEYDLTSLAILGPFSKIVCEPFRLLMRSLQLQIGTMNNWLPCLTWSHHLEP